MQKLPGFREGREKEGLILQLSTQSAPEVWYLHIGNSGSAVLVGDYWALGTTFYWYGGLMPWKIQPVDSASAIHVTLVPLISLQGLEDTTFSFGWCLSHTYAPVSEMRNCLCSRLLSHADLPGHRQTSFYLSEVWGRPTWYVLGHLPHRDLFQRHFLWGR